MEKAIIVTAPSGAGKTTLVKKLLLGRSDLSFSISACTREKREAEIHAKDYYFLDEAVFRAKIESNDFVEWEEVYDGMFYGTLKSEIKRIWAEGKAVIFDIDVKGATQLKEILGDQALAIFIAPPSTEVLKARLKSRGTESTETLKRRFDKSVFELQYQSKMDTFVINDELEEAYMELNEKVTQFLNQ